MVEGRTKVLLVDDDDGLRFALKKALTRQGYDVTEASTGADALRILRNPTASQHLDIVFLDLRLGDMSGIGVLQNLAGQTLPPIVVLTGHGTVASAVDAMKLGAYSFLEKPVDADALEPVIHQAVKRARNDAGPQHRLIGRSDAIADIREFVRRLSRSNETVFIFGETGTGKEVVARILHEASDTDGPFVGLNAASITGELFESELFGHKKGAFTGADSDHKGLFEQAAGGTLFLDEVGEMNLDLQAKLLRALETRTARPVGGTREFSIEARIVAATNRNLAEEVKAGRFREDLYFRLQVFPVFIPPLRHRKEDIEPLVHHLLERIGEVCTFTPDAMALLREHPWPGNVRELLNTLRRVTMFSDGKPINRDLVDRMLAASVFTRAKPTDRQNVTSTSLAEAESAHIKRVLEQNDGNITQTAIALGIDRRTLQRKLKDPSQ